MKSYPLNIFILSVCLCLPLTACKDDSVSSLSPSENMGDTEYIGKAVGNFTAEEWYPGGSLGTTDNVTAGCYEDETKAVEEQGLVKEFNLGESFFERNYNTNTPPFNGLGPASVRSSCIDCHPGYGHGKRQDDYHANTYGNGYLLVVYHPDVPGSNDGAYISEVTGMPQTQATSPFLPPIDEDQINISWHTVTAMESGLPLQFPDGEKYELIYPEVTIPQTAFNTTPQPSDFEVRLESTIGIIGTGLIDAIPEDSLKKQYATEAAAGQSQSGHVGQGRQRLGIISILFFVDLARRTSRRNTCTRYGQTIHLCPHTCFIAGWSRCQCHLEHYQRFASRPS